MALRLILLHSLREIRYSRYCLFTFTVPGTTMLGQRCLYWRRRRRRRRPVPAGASAGSVACICAARLQAASQAAGGAAARCATARPAIEHGTSVAPPPSREPQLREDATCATSASGVPALARAA